MQLRFRGRLGIADAVSVANAVLGLLGILVALSWNRPALAARVVLLAAVADGLDGVIARRYRSTQAGETLDSLSDVVSFGVAPAAIISAIATTASTVPRPRLLGVAVAGTFLAAAVVRLSLYTVDEDGSDETIGVPTTLAGTIIAAAVLAGIQQPALLLAGGVGFAYLMLTDAVYPDLRPRDAIALGGVQALAIVVPTVAWRGFPRALLVAALVYLVLGPRYYWGTPSTA